MDTFPITLERLQSQDELSTHRVGQKKKHNTSSLISPGKEGSMMALAPSHFTERCLHLNKNSGPSSLLSSLLPEPGGWAYLGQGESTHRVQSGKARSQVVRFPHIVYHLYKEKASQPTFLFWEDEWAWVESEGEHWHGCGGVGRAGVGLGLLSSLSGIVGGGSELKGPGTLFKWLPEFGFILFKNLFN